MEMSFIQMFGSGVQQLKNIAEESKQHVLSNNTFEQYFSAFSNGIGSLIQILSNPAIKIFDSKDESLHVMVGGERWKLIDYLVRYGEKTMPPLTVTNPMIYKLETITIDRAHIESAMENYEAFYDMMIGKVMDINEAFGMAMTTNSNSEKVKAMQTACTIFNDVYESMKVYYSEPKKEELN